jgi:hypothetical protein
VLARSTSTTTHEPSFSWAWRLDPATLGLTPRISTDELADLSLGVCDITGPART